MLAHRLIICVLDWLAHNSLLPRLNTSYDYSAPRNGCASQSLCRITQALAAKVNVGVKERWIEVPPPSIVTVPVDVVVADVDSAVGIN